MKTILLIICLAMQTGFAFTQTTPVDENKPSMSVTIFISPFSSDAILLLDKHFKNATITVYNAFGQAVEELEDITGESITLYLDDLSGVFFLKVTEDNKTFTTNKFTLANN